MKISAVPGMVTQLNLTPTRAGRFDISCSEYCGANHSTMQAALVVEPQGAFDRWLAAARVAAAKTSTAISLAGGDAAAGKTAFAQKCAACHNAAGGFDAKIVGPGLLHLTDDPQHPQLVDGKPATADEIADLLVKGYTGPIGAMPNRQANGLSDADIANLVAYLVSLK